MVHILHEIGDLTLLATEHVLLIIIEYLRLFLPIEPGCHGQVGGLTVMDAVELSTVPQRTGCHEKLRTVPQQIACHVNHIDMPRSTPCRWVKTDQEIDVDCPKTS